jgi:hypothetical protein
MPFLSEKKLLAAGIVYRSQNYGILIFQGNAHRKNGETVNEVCGAVQWVHQPAARVLACTALVFFGQNLMVRVATLDQLDDCFLCCQVCLSHVVKATFGLDLQRLKFIVVIQKNSAALLDAVYGGFY